MRWRKRLWLAVAVTCLAGTILEIPDIRLTGRYVRTARPRNAPADKPATTAGLTDDVHRTDPEAAAILTWSLAKPEDRNPAQGVAAYPDNEFFLAQLAQKLADDHCVDPQAALAPAERLIALAPDNAHYRYLRGWVLLKGCRASGRRKRELISTSPFSLRMLRTDRSLGEDTFPDLSGAMAFVSDPQEVKASLRRLMDPLVAQWRENYASYTSRRVQRGSVTTWRSPEDEFATENLSHSFYLALRGVPIPQATALLKTYVRRERIAPTLREKRRRA